MSSPSPRRPSRWAAAVVAAGAAWSLATAIPAGALPAAGAAGDPVVTVQSAGSDADPQVRLVADTGTRDPQTIRARDLSVTASDAGSSNRRVPIQAVPLLSGRSDVVAVLDTASAAAASLPEVRSGLTDLLLQLPPGARTGAVVTGDRPQVLAPLASGGTGALGQLSEVEASGSPAKTGGSTGNALTVALQALGGPGRPPADSASPSSARPRVVVLQTVARDAGGESAAQLGERLRRAGVVLEVVTGSGGSAYWRSVAAATGGGVAVVGSGQAEAAFTQVSDALRHTFLLSFARPDGPLDGVSVRFGGAAGGAGAFVDLTTQGASAASSADGAGSTAGGSGPSLGAVVNVVALMLLLLAAALVLHGLRRRPRGAHEAGIPVRPVPTMVAPRSQLEPPPPAIPPTPDSPARLEPSPSPSSQASPSSQPSPSSNGVSDAAVSDVPLDVAPEAAPDRAPSSAPVAARDAARDLARDDVPDALAESPTVIDARRRARATGAAVAAAARAAAAVRTPVPRSGPGAQRRVDPVEPDRQGGPRSGTNRSDDHPGQPQA